jgi:hypothetical protein
MSFLTYEDYFGKILKSSKQNILDENKSRGYLCRQLRFDGI